MRLILATILALFSTTAFAESSVGDTVNLTGDVACTTADTIEQGIRRHKTTNIEAAMVYFKRQIEAGECKKAEGPGVITAILKSFDIPPLRVAIIELDMGTAAPVYVAAFVREL
jgi:hypothetical protein